MSTQGTSKAFSNRLQTAPILNSRCLKLLLTPSFSKEAFIFWRNKKSGRKRRAKRELSCRCIGTVLRKTKLGRVNKHRETAYEGVAKANRTSRAGADNRKESTDSDRNYECR